MFYGLNNLIKKILPKQLFYRGLLIVATPIIILQITISVVFFDSLWIKTNKGMTRSLVSEIKTFLDTYKNENINKNYISSLFQKNFELEINYVDSAVLPKSDEERWFSPMDRTLRRELKSNNLNYWFDTVSFKNKVELKISHESGYFQFFIPKERLTNSSARIFAFWITLPAILVISIAMIFLKIRLDQLSNLQRHLKSLGEAKT